MQKLLMFDKVLDNKSWWYEIKTVLENSWESETSDCETETKKCQSFIKIAIKWLVFF